MKWDSTEIYDSQTIFISDGAVEDVVEALYTAKARILEKYPSAYDIRLTIEGVDDYGSASYWSKLEFIRSKTDQELFDDEQRKAEAERHQEERARAEYERLKARFEK